MRRYGDPQPRTNSQPFRGNSFFLPNPIEAFGRLLRRVFSMFLSIGTSSSLALPICQTRREAIILQQLGCSFRLTQLISILSFTYFLATNNMDIRNFTRNSTTYLLEMRIIHLNRLELTLFSSSSSCSSSSSSSEGNDRIDSGLLKYVIYLVAFVC